MYKYKGKGKIVKERVQEKEREKCTYISKYRGKGIAKKSVQKGTQYNVHIMYIYSDIVGIRVRKSITYNSYGIDYPVDPSEHGATVGVIN